MKKSKQDDGKVQEVPKVSKVSEDNEKEELKASLARALADYANLSKRFIKERDEVIIRANKNLLEELLPVLDNLERAQLHLQDQGLQMGIDQLNKILDKYGLIEIDTSDEFDSTLHEAIDSREGGESGKIAEVVAKGYQWRDGVVLRPAKVIVYK